MQQLAIHEKLLKYQKHPTKIELCFIMYRIPFASLGILMEAEIVHGRARLDQAIKLWYLEEN